MSSVFSVPLPDPRTTELPAFASQEENYYEAVFLVRSFVLCCFTPITDRHYAVSDFLILRVQLQTHRAAWGVREKTVVKSFIVRFVRSAVEERVGAW